MKQLVPALFAVGALMALVGAAVFITGWIYAPYIYTIGAGICSSCPNQYSGKGEKQNIETLAHPANIRRRRISADRSFHVLYPGK